MPGLVGEGDVTAIGDVLAGTAPGRTHDDEITMFDSTGLAIQDLAIAVGKCRRRCLRLPMAVAELKATLPT